MISRSPCHSTLEFLDVNGCEVSENGIDQILGTSTKLEELNFTRKPEDIENKLRINYPHVRINNPQFGFP